MQFADLAVFKDSRAPGPADVWEELLLRCTVVTSAGTDALDLVQVQTFQAPRLGLLELRFVPVLMEGTVPMLVLRSMCQSDLKSHASRCFCIPVSGDKHPLSSPPPHQTKIKAWS